MRNRNFWFTLLVIVALVAVIIGALSAVSKSSASVQTAATSTCVKPTGSITNVKLLNYMECRFNEQAGVTSPTPSPTATTPSPTVTTPSPTATTPRPTATTPSPTATTPKPTPTPTETTAPTTSEFPDATNTGVPAGTKLRKVPSEVSSGPGWTWDDRWGGTLRVNDDGAVLEGLDISGSVEVFSSNVTISKVKITASGEGWLVGVRHGTGVTIKDSTLSGGGKRILVPIKDIYGDAEVSVLRNNIADWTSGVQISRGVVQGNYVHSPKLQEGDHINGYTHNGGRSDGSVLIKDNTFLNPFSQTDAISFFQDFGNVKNVTVDHNLMAGGGYCLYAGGGSQLSSNVVIKNNKFSTMYYEKCGYWGPVTAWQPNGPGNIWTNNTWADGPKKGQSINP